MLKKTPEIPIVIFTGGQSSRLQVNNRRKWQLSFGDYDLLGYIVSRLESQNHLAVINCKQQDNILLKQRDLTLINDFDCIGTLKIEGPLAGLVSTLTWAKQQCYQWVATLPCDTPFFPVNLIQQLIEVQAQQSTDAVIASSQNRLHPVCGIWSVSLLDKLISDVYDRDVRAIGKWAQEFAAIAEFPETKWEKKGLDPFFNINTLDDYEKAVDLIAKESD